MRRRVAILALGALAAVLPACGLSRPGITNGAVTACFKSRPAARAAVHDTKAHLIGVHRLTADELPARLRAPHVPAEADATVCAVAFRGSFRAGQVTGAPGGATGRYAVVLVSEKHLDVVGSYVGDQLPRSLKGRIV